MIIKNVLFLTPILVFIDYLYFLKNLKLSRSMISSIETNLKADERQIMPYSRSIVNCSIQYCGDGITSYSNYLNLVKEMDQLNDNKLQILRLKLTNQYLLILIWHNPWK